MSSCVLLYSCFGQLIKDQPHLFVFEPHGLDQPTGFNWLRIHQGIEDFGLAVRRDRPITVEGRHGAGVAKILVQAFHSSQDMEPYSDKLQKQGQP